MWKRNSASFLNFVQGEFFEFLKLIFYWKERRILQVNILLKGTLNRVNSFCNNKGGYKRIFTAFYPRFSLPYDFSKKENLLGT